MFQAKAILDKRRCEGEEEDVYEYLIEWEDDYPNSWESAESVCDTLLSQYENLNINA